MKKKGIDNHSYGCELILSGTEARPPVLSMLNKIQADKKYQIFHIQLLAWLLGKTLYREKSLSGPPDKLIFSILPIFYIKKNSAVEKLRMTEQTKWGGGASIQYAAYRTPWAKVAFVLRG
jgi:hypothetical protein